MKHKLLILFFALFILGCSENEVEKESGSYAYYNSDKFILDRANITEVEVTGGIQINYHLHQVILRDGRERFNIGFYFKSMSAEEIEEGVYKIGWTDLASFLLESPQKKNCNGMCYNYNTKVDGVSFFSDGEVDVKKEGGKYTISFKGVLRDHGVKVSGKYIGKLEKWNN